MKKVKILFLMFLLLFSINLTYSKSAIASTTNSYIPYISIEDTNDTTISISNSTPNYDNLGFITIDRAIINSKEQDGVMMIDIVNTELVKKGNGVFTLTLPRYFTWKNLDVEVIEGDIEITKQSITNSGKTFNVNVKNVPTEPSVLYLYFSINSSRYNRGDTVSARIGGKSSGKLKGKYILVGDF